MKVLICCDFSAAGKYVLEQAYTFLKAFPGAEINVHTVMDAGVVSASGMYNNAEIIDTLEKESGQVKQWAEGIFSNSTINFTSQIGYPAKNIAEKAAGIQADLLIIGTHGRTGLGRILMGSVAQDVLRHCTCNTLVVPVKHIKDE
jgi:nucleotide-binding universal stress UspA family protein